MVTVNNTAAVGVVRQKLRKRAIAEPVEADQNRRHQQDVQIDPEQDRMHSGLEQHKSGKNESCKTAAGPACQFQVTRLPPEQNENNRRQAIEQIKKQLFLSRVCHRPSLD
ncbi:hypothetical protein [Roseibium aggregatum]|uniref:hypothetical protein n=1 Tax=Roseibium aggregatum TaxID=187304 RepID=UPI003A975CC6